MKSSLRPALWLLAAMVISCSANPSGSSYGGGTGGAGGGGTGGSGDDGGTLPSPDASAGTGGALPVNPEAGSDVQMSDGGTCSALEVPAEPYPLDMYIMMDQSGSMSSPVNLMQPLGPTQWDAVKSAFVNFLNATPSTGLSMGIQYFPLPVVPWSSLPSCSGSNCGSGETCADIGTGSHCMDNCTSNANCSSDSECMSFDDGNGGSIKLCSNDSCNVDVYATPEVEIAPLPGVNAALLASLNAHGPLTMTPSAPSLKGAIKHAKAWAQAHPNTTTIVVLATDGAPTACTSGGVMPIVEVQQIAAAGVADTPSIKTFVIGVVTAGLPQTAQALNSIAANGGTGQAFIIDPAQDMTGQFAAALEAIRGAYMECEFQIPTPSSMPNWDEVNVVYIPVDTGVQPVNVYYVEDVSQCDPVLGGWYYDVNPAQGVPTKIILCPQSCDFVQDYGGEIKIQIGCKTLKPPK